jgi:outer membrane immunogenic protein
MKKLATAIATVALVATPAFAAPPAPAPAPVYNWTGWYVGGNVGANFGTDKTDFNAAPVTVESCFKLQCLFNETSGLAGSDTVYPGGFVGGGEVGYNWQLSPIWVVGLEADFQGIDNKESGTLTNNFSVTVVPGPGFFAFTGSTVLDYHTQIDWFGTVRGRIGYLWGDGAVLTYVTGGLAYGEVKINGTSAVSGTGMDFLGNVSPFSNTQAFGQSQVNTGWVVGTGTEGKLLIPGWTYKIEGLYMDLGTLDAAGSGAISGFSGQTIIFWPDHQ